MSGVRRGLVKTGLLLILTEAQGERFEAAAEAASVAAAAGRPVAVLLRGSAILHAPEPAASLGLLLDLGAELGACQTAMAAAGLSADSLDPRIAATGLVLFMSGRENWQMLLA